MTYTIAISNEKGGVAKTTSTLSLGAALAELGNKVLVMDMDPQANLTLALGFLGLGHALVWAQEPAPSVAEIHKDEIHLRNLRQISFGQDK